MKKLLLVFVLAAALPQSGMVKANGIDVDASEDPNRCPGLWFTNPQCQHALVYRRVDDAPIVTHKGNPSSVLGATLDCNNCESQNTMFCTATLSAEFTESLTINIDSAIQAGIAGIKSSLQSSIGAVNGRTQKFTTTCGDRDIAPYTRTIYQVYQNVTLGKKAKVESAYTCHLEAVGGSVPPCNPMGHLSGGFSCGTRTSTTTGNVATMTGGCNAKDVPCPNSGDASGDGSGDDCSDPSY